MRSSLAVALYCWGTLAMAACTNTVTGYAPEQVPTPPDDTAATCRVIAPQSQTIIVGAPLSIVAQVFAPDVTDITPAIDDHPDLMAQVAWTPADESPMATPEELSWLDTAGTLGWDDADAPGWDQYELELPAPDSGTYHVLARFSLDAGQTWTACDLTASVDGLSPGDAGQFTAVPDPCSPNPCSEPPAPTCSVDGMSLLTAITPGTCTIDSLQPLCDYEIEESDCSALGGSCAAGACVEPAPPPPVVRRVAPWPGRGIQIYVERPEPGLSVEFKDGSGTAYPAAVTQMSELSGLTVIAIEATSELWEHLSRADRALQIAENLPEGERIAVWFNGTFASDFTSRRAHIVSRILGLLPVDGPPVDQDLVSEILAEVEGPYGAVHRDLVVIGADPEVEPTAESIVSRRGTLVRVGVCPNMEEDEPFLLSVGDATVLLEAPEPMEAMIWVPCSAAAAAIDAYPFGETIAMYMDDEELANYQVNNNNDTKNDWTLKLAIGPGLPEPAAAHFRGNGSLVNCQRKSITVNLDGGKPRRLGPDSADDEFLLISMCLDDRYFQQYLANHLLQALGLFMPRQRYVRVTLNGDDMGVYLLLENPTETILRRHAAIEAVVRRRNEAWAQEPNDVKFPSEAEEIQTVRQNYETMIDLIDDEEPENLADALAEHLDIEMFTQWLAFHTYFRNGDYVDELYLYASQESDSWMWRLSGWDADDLLSNCHHSGQNAIPDRWNIYYCAEGNLEYALIESPELYERFIDHLENLITEILPYQDIASTLFMVRDALFEHLDTETVCGAMVEIINNNPQAASCAGAQADINARMAEFLTGMSNRRDTLLDRIAEYRDQ